MNIELDDLDLEELFKSILKSMSSRAKDKGFSRTSFFGYLKLMKINHKDRPKILTAYVAVGLLKYKGGQMICINGKSVSTKYYEVDWDGVSNMETPGHMGSWES